MRIRQHTHTHGWRPPARFWKQPFGEENSAGLFLRVVANFKLTFAPKTHVNFYIKYSLNYRRQPCRHQHQTPTHKTIQPRAGGWAGGWSGERVGKRAGGQAGFTRAWRSSNYKESDGPKPKFRCKKTSPQVWVCCRRLGFAAFSNKTASDNIPIPMPAVFAVRLPIFLYLGIAPPYPSPPLLRRRRAVSGIC